MHRRVPALLLLLASLSAATAAAADPPWTEVKSAHFTVLTNGSEKDGRRVATQFERMRAVFHLLLPSAGDDAAAPITVLALRDRKSFRSLEPESYLAKNQLDLAGFFQRTPERNFVLLRLDAQGDHPFATVYHEYTHYMLRKTEGWIPLWLNEGLAEFYQNTNLSSPRDVRVGQPSVEDILYLRQNRLLPLPTLLKVDHASPYYHDEQKGSVFYAESWALTHFLIATDGAQKTHRLGDYARLVEQHQDSVTAAQQAFGDLRKLEAALTSYIQQSDFKEFALSTPVVFDETSFAARPVPLPEADAMRATVLLEVGRVAEAQTMLDAVLQAAPKNVLAHETMGALKHRQNDIPAARKWYAEAVELDSGSYLAHFNYAAMSLQAGDREHDRAIEESLKAAIKLNPRFAPAFDALAQFYGSRHTNLAEAHSMSLKAVELEPESLAYRINTAQVLAEQEKFGEALRVLKAARRVAKSLTETDAVETRITAVEQNQARVEESRQTQTSSPALSGSVVTAVQSNGRSILPAEETPAPALDLPAGAPSGPRHTVSGVLRGVKCSYPTLLTFTLERAGKPVSLYSNNYFKVVFTAANYDPPAEINPCSGIDGMKAKVEYGEVESRQVAGQVVSIELSQ